MRIALQREDGRRREPKATDSRELNYLQPSRTTIPFLSLYLFFFSFPYSPSVGFLFTSLLLSFATIRRSCTIGVDSALCFSWGGFWLDWAGLGFGLGLSTKCRSWIQGQGRWTCGLSLVMAPVLNFDHIFLDFLWIWIRVIWEKIWIGLGWIWGSKIEAGSGAGEDGQADRAWFWPEP